MPDDLIPPFAPGAVAADTLPVSQRIRARLEAHGARFFANDNISEFIAPGELDALVDEVAAKMQGVLASLVIDTAADHNTHDTGRRVAKMFVKEVFGGRYAPMPPVTAFPNVARTDELMVVGPVTVRSACSHHLCPVIGKVWIGVLPSPDTALIGLSKYARIANWVMRRPQIQEEAVIQLADALEAVMAPRGAGAGHGGGPLLYALARRRGHGGADDQPRHARRLPHGRRAARRVPGQHPAHGLSAVLTGNVQQARVLISSWPKVRGIDGKTGMKWCAAAENRGRRTRITSIS